MEAFARGLPVGIQDFEKLRTEKCLYVDKTQYIYDLTRNSVPYFLSRPRRFGKSLFISTLKAYFLGKKELFEGLAIAELEKEWTTYPVIYIDISMVGGSDLSALKSVLNYKLKNYESKWGISSKYDDLSVRFSSLIEAAAKKTGQKVVVLVDEYDKTLNNNMEESEKQEEISRFLKGFYGVLKAMDYCLRFVFLTGLTKFSQMSTFGDMNQFIDISMKEDYADICGLSEKELLQYFEPELRTLAVKTEKTYDETLAEMKKRYGGFRFAKTGDDIYNLNSVCDAFYDKHFGCHWFETCTPSCLINALKSGIYDISKLDKDVTIGVRAIDYYQSGVTSIVPLLYKSGYLTIKSYNRHDQVFTLGFPNEEVKYSFLHQLVTVRPPVDCSAMFGSIL
jgi:hypothetical protein